VFDGLSVFRGRVPSSITSIAISGQLDLASQSLALDARWYRAVAALMCVSEFIEIEQFRRPRLAARVTLTFLMVDAYF